MITLAFDPTEARAERVKNNVIQITEVSFNRNWWDGDYAKVWHLCESQNALEISDNSKEDGIYKKFRRL